MANIGIKANFGGDGGVMRLDTRVHVPRAALKALEEAQNLVTAATSSSDAAPGKIKPFNGQDFVALRDECLRKKTLFEDSTFPPIDASVYGHLPSKKQLVWKRPREISKWEPKFVVGDRSRFDVTQGELGDCWLLASVASLSMHEELLNKVVPQDNEYQDKEAYAGIYHFRFWQYGEWIDVVVDDLLPTYNDNLVFMHSREHNEFWSALFEKAYAKLQGSYEALKGGSSSEAMVDFTGGMTEVINLKGKEPKNLLDIMLKANQRSCLMGCSIDPKPGVVEAQLPSGLIAGHAYSITDIRLVSIQMPGQSTAGGKIPLVRVRNPWGNEAEWMGAWSDKSREWSIVPEDERKTMGLTFEADGEFWMAFKDFCSNFEKLEICHLGPDSLEADQLGGKPKKRFEQIVINGSWIKRVSAGGCRNYIDTFWTNPQYRVTVVDADDDDNENMGTLIVGLMQKDRRRLQAEKQTKSGSTDPLLSIGYVVYQIKEEEHLPDTPLDINFFKRHVTFARCPAYANAREICCRHRMPPGKYMVVPSTFDPNLEADFLVRLYSEKPQEAHEADNETTFNIPSVVGDSEKGKQQQGLITDAVRKAFAEASGEDLAIDAYELREILDMAFKKDFAFDGFSLESARSMISYHDVNQTGKLGIDDFVKLWNDLRMMRAVFRRFDSDKSGKLNSYELREMYKCFGVSLSNRTFQSLVQRYSDKQGQINFEDFVLSAFRMRTIFETVKAQEKDMQSGKAAFKLDQLVQLMIYT